MMGSEGAMALADAIPRCPSLQEVDASQCDLPQAAEAALQALARPGLTLHLTQEDDY